MTFYISIALVLLLSIGVLGVHERIDLFSDRTRCSKASKAKKYVHFSVFYPKDSSPAISKLVSNIDLGSIVNIDDSQFSGTMTQYCNSERCSVELAPEPIRKLNKRPILGVKETAADWPENSRMSVYAEMKIQETKLGALGETPDKLHIAIIIANKLPYYELKYYLKYREFLMNDSIKKKFLYMPQLKAVFKNRWKYDYYIVVATNNIIHQYTEFHRSAGISSKAVVVQLEKVVDNPLALPYRIARSNTCTWYQKPYEEYMFSLTTDRYYEHMLKNKEFNHAGWKFIPVFHIVGAYKAGESEYSFFYELLNKKRMHEYMETVRRSFPTAQFLFSVFTKGVSGLYPEVIGGPGLSPQGYIDGIKKEGTLQKSADPYPRYHDYFSEFYLNGLPRMKDPKVPTVIKPFYFLIADKVPNSITNIGNFKFRDTHYYHWTLKKRVAEVDGEICLLRTDSPDNIVPDVAKVDDVITEVKQTYLTEYKFPEIIEAMTEFVRYIMHKNEHLILNVPNVSTRLEWSPVEYPGIPAVRKNIQVAIIRRTAYPPEYGTLYAHAMGRRGYSLQQMLAAFYNVHIERITTTYISGLDLKKLSRVSCESDLNNYVKDRFRDDMYTYTGHVDMPDWVGIVYGCFAKMFWQYEDRVAVIFEDQLKPEMINPKGLINSGQPLNLKKIFVVKTTNIKYNPDELKKRGVYILQAKDCSNLLTCVAVLIADIFGHFVPFIYI